MIFDSDLDIRVARTLPTKVYADPERFGGALHPFMLVPAEFMR